MKIHKTKWPPSLIKPHNLPLFATDLRCSASDIGLDSNSPSRFGEKENLYMLWVPVTRSVIVRRSPLHYRHYSRPGYGLEVNLTGSTLVDCRPRGRVERNCPLESVAVVVCSGERWQCRSRYCHAKTLYGCGSTIDLKRTQHHPQNPVFLHLWQWHQARRVR